MTKPEKHIEESEVQRLAFAMIKGMTPTLATEVISRIDSIDRFFSAKASEIAAATGLNSRVISDENREALLRNARSELEFVKQNKVSITYFDDEAYPRRLLSCEDAPMALFSLGETDLDDTHMVSIVGTRHATIFGQHFVDTLVEDLANQLDGLVIVSGLAYGIDIAAHRAALRFGIPTVAVTAHPLNQIYPADHRDDAVRMLHNGGALVTEFPSINRVHKSNFIARNRIIAGLSDATIVVESDTHGGALVTANLAMEYGRDVFAVPGRPSDQYSRGTNSLIATQSAALLNSADDLISAMRWTSKSHPVQKEITFDLTPDQEKVLKLLRQSPGITVNELVNASAIKFSTLTEILFTLEMMDIIAATPGGSYSVLA